MIMSVMLCVVIGILCAFITNAMIPTQPPEAIPVVSVIGSLGAGLGTMYSVGPALAGVSLVPALMGSAAVIFFVYLMHEVALANNWL